MGFSSYLRNRVLDRLIPDSWVSLHEADPGDVGAAELKGEGYHRQKVSFHQASAGTSSNQEMLDFPDMPTGDVVAFGLWDAAIGGNYLGGGLFLDVRSVRDGDTYRILPRNITMALE